MLSVYPGHRQHVTPVGDEISRHRRDDAVRPAAELCIAHPREHLYRQRGAEHRGRDREPGNDWVDVRGLIDHRAEIDELRGVAEDLAGRLGGDDLAPLELAAKEE